MDNFNQFKSNFRKGEPMDHLHAKEFIGNLLKWSGYTIQYEYPLLGNLEKPYIHNYDVVAFKYILVVEVDDPDLHAKKHKIQNDKIAESYVDKHFPRARFVRLNKDELNSLSTVPEYLDTNFWPNVEKK